MLHLLLGIKHGFGALAKFDQLLEIQSRLHLLDLKEDDRAL